MLREGRPVRGSEQPAKSTLVDLSEDVGREARAPTARRGSEEVSCTVQRYVDTRQLSPGIDFIDEFDDDDDDDDIVVVGQQYQTTKKGSLVIRRL